MPANIPAQSFAGMARSYGCSEHLDSSSSTQLGQSDKKAALGWLRFPA